MHKYFASLDLNLPGCVVCVAFSEGTEGGECIEISAESRLRNSWRSLSGVKFQVVLKSCSFLLQSEDLSTPWGEVL